jgi:hypothetical protein
VTGLGASVIELDTHRMKEKTTVISGAIRQWVPTGKVCQDARSDPLGAALDWKRQGVQPNVDEKKKGSTL